MPVFRSSEETGIFGSHMEAALSEDLVSWKRFASGVNGGNRLFDGLFTDKKAFDYVGRNDRGGYSVWAPDVIYNGKLGLYMMYFCTTSSYVKSNICFALSENPEGPYRCVDTIIYSGFIKGTADTKTPGGPTPSTPSCFMTGRGGSGWPTAPGPGGYSCWG